MDFEDAESPKVPDRRPERLVSWTEGDPEEIAKTFGSLDKALVYLSDKEVQKWELGDTRESRIRRLVAARRYKRKGEWMLGDGAVADVSSINSLVRKLKSIPLGWLYSNLTYAEATFLKEVDEGIKAIIPTKREYKNIPEFLTH